MEETSSNGKKKPPFQRFLRDPSSLGGGTGRTHLVPAALAGLKAGQDLALDGRHPGVSLLQTLGLEVPGLSREGHDDEVGVLFVCEGTRAKDGGGQARFAGVEKRLMAVSDGEQKATEEEEEEG